MKKSTAAETLLILLIISIPFVYAAIVYPTLPQTIPTHFGIDGKADGFGSRNSIWTNITISSAIAIGIYLLMRFLPTIDPKKKAGQAPEIYRKIALVVVVFLAGISLMVVRSAKSESFEVAKFILPLTGLFFAILGNYMHSIKPNYFVGFRTPWTLENEDNWRKTHQLVSKIWVPGGLLIAIGTFILPMNAALVFLLVLITAMVVIPLVFSYRYFKKHQS
jgi:uncharacterized membrane protein